MCLGCPQGMTIEQLQQQQSQVGQQLPSDSPLPASQLEDIPDDAVRRTPEYEALMQALNGGVRSV